MKYKKTGNQSNGWLVVILFTALIIMPTSVFSQDAPAEDSFCSGCGTELGEEDFFCGKCGHATQPEQTIFCWRCGIRIPVDADFCSRCGSVVSCKPGNKQTPAPGPISVIDYSNPAEAEIVIAYDPEFDIPQPANQNPDKRPDLTMLSLTEQRMPVIPPVTEMKKRNFFFSGGDEVKFPPRLFDLPTGAVLPSLSFHTSRGWSFGFSDKKDADRWVLSVGLGGVGEAIISSSRMEHVTGPKSNALGGFRLRLPVAWLGEETADKLSLALNIASTKENNFSSSGSFSTEDGVTISSLFYQHRETTLGIASTWNAEPTRFHAILHATDLRAERITFSGGGLTEFGPDQKDTFFNIGLGVDYAARHNTLIIAEIHTAPRVSFKATTGELIVSKRLEYALGMRFFPIPFFGFDAMASIDEDAVGLADVEIGAGFHLILGGN